jgi:hypothetical protein
MLPENDGDQVICKRLEAKLLRHAAQVLSMPDHRSLLTRRAEALDREADELELGSAPVANHA